MKIVSKNGNIQTSVHIYCNNKRGVDTMEEQWKPIIVTKHGKTYDYTGLYEVSNIDGKIRSLSYSGHGKVQLLKPNKAKKGYYSIGLSKDGKVKRFYVHRIVAEVFIPNPHGYPEVNHLDEDKTNNSVDNLEWVTHKNNAAYSLNKKVICLETGQVFDCILQAKEWLGLKSHAPIGLCCQGKRKHAGGYSWKYYEEE